MTSFRTLPVAIGMVGAPVCLAVGNLLAVRADGSAAQQATTIAVHSGQFLAAAVLQGTGFALLGAVGVGLAMLVRARGSLLAVIGAILTVIGGVVMSGAVITTAFVEAALTPATAARVLPALQSNAALGGLFDFALVAAVGGLLCAVALLIGRPVRVWKTVLLLIGLLLTFFGGGTLGAVLSIPFLIAVALLAGDLLQGADRELPRRTIPRAMTVEV